MDLIVHDKTGLVRPEITTIRQPEHQIGKLTAEILLKQLEGKGEMSTEEQSQRTLLSPYLEEKESC